MLAKLLKFVIVTRFSKPFLGLIAFFLAYQVFIRVFVASNASTPSGGGFSYYGVGFSVFFITVSLLFGGLFVLKSDRDFLLTLPVSRRELSLALFISQFIGFGASLILFFGFYAASESGLIATIVFAADIAFFALMITSLGVISNILSDKARVALGIALGAWCLSALTGFQFTPVSMFAGNLFYGSAVLSGVTAVVVPVALRELSHLELGSMRTLLRATSTEYKQSMGFSGKTPVGAIYSYHLSILELVGRVNVGGATSFRTARVRTSTVLIITSTAALVYYVLASPGVRLFHSAVVAIVPLALGIVTLVLMSQGAFSSERGWLAFTAMDPAKYLRHPLLSRVASALAIMAPFAIADFALAYEGITIALNSSVVLLLTVPAASIITTYFVARFGAVQQVREEGMMPGQFSVRQMVVILPTYIVLGLIGVSEISLRVSLIIAAALLVVAFLLMLIPGAWRRLAFVLTERGFV